MRNSIYNYDCKVYKTNPLSADVINNLLNDVVELLTIISATHSMAKSTSDNHHINDNDPTLWTIFARTVKKASVEESQTKFSRFNKRSHSGFTHISSFGKVKTYSRIQPINSIFGGV